MISTLTFVFQQFLFIASCLHVIFATTFDYSSVYLDRSSAALTSDDFVRSNKMAELLSTNWLFYSNIIIT